MEVDLAASYRHCQALHRTHGRSYYLATRLLPAWKRRHVHALYGFSRYADDIVDAVDGGTAGQRAARLAELAARFRAGDREIPVLPAVLHTIGVFELDPADFEAFLGSMAMDLTVSRYQTYPDLLAYMAGSAAAIGSMMLPVLQAADLRAARAPARALGLAFQLTNFIRDVGEDLGRDRIYLPLADLARFGVREVDLVEAVRVGRSSARIKALIEFEVARARQHYAEAAPGIGMLAPGSQACIRAAYLLYGGILDEVVRAGYEVLAGRVRVPVPRRLAVAAACLLIPAGRPVRLPGTARPDVTHVAGQAAGVAGAAVGTAGPAGAGGTTLG